MEKKQSLSITFQELFKYEIRFSKYLAVGYWRLKNVTVKVYLPIFGPFFPFFLENENFSEKWCMGQFIPINAL